MRHWDQMTRMDKAMSSRIKHLGVLVLLLVPVASVLVGFFASGILDEAVLAHSRALVLLAMACVATQTVCYFAFRASIGPSAIAVGGALFWLVAFAYYAGLESVASALLLIACALAVTSLVDPRGNVSCASTRVLLGLAVVVATVGWLLPLPTHDSRWYLWGAAILAVSRQLHVRIYAGRAWSSWLDLGANYPFLLGAVVLISGFASLGLWLPTINYDDQSAHLILQNQLLKDGYYHLDVSSQVWAVAPWFNNVLHAVSAMSIGEPTRAPVNLIWLLLGIIGAYRLAMALGATQSGALLAALIFASHPLTSYFGTTLQVDAAVAVLLLYLAIELVEWRVQLQAPWRLGILIGALLALKISNVIYLFLPCGYIAWVALRDKQWRWLLGVVATSLMIGASSYVYAWAITGNPAFPLFNTIFESPFFPAREFSDARWHAGLSFSTLWDLTFDTPKYMEAYPGGAGLALFGLLGGVVIAFLRGGPMRWVALWICAAGAIMFGQVQYLRYVFPAIALLCTVAVAAFDVHALRMRALLAVTFTLAIANSMLMPSTSWIMHGGAWNRLIHEGREYGEVLVNEAAPHRSLMFRLEQRSPDFCVLVADPSSPFIAGSPGRAVSVAWYDPKVNEAWAWSNANESGERWQLTLISLGVSHIIVPRNENAPLRKALARMGGSVQDRQANLELWSLPERPVCDWRFLSSRDRAHRLIHPWDVH